MKSAVGIDIGGTKIAAGLIGENGACLWNTVLKSKPDDAEAMYLQVHHAVSEVLNNKPENCEITAIGAGVPGKLNIEDGVVLYQNNLPWVNYSLAERLKSDFNLPCIIDNDVYMAAFAEYKGSQAAKNETFIYMTISTGISCCIIHQGEFMRGAGFAGEIGMTVCGKNELPNCQAEYITLEQTASGKALLPFVQAHQEKGQQGEVIDMLLAEGSSASEKMQKKISILASSIYSLFCIIDPHTLVLGGGVIHGNKKLLHLFSEEIIRYQSPISKEIIRRLEVSKLGKNAGMIGAGQRAFQKAGESGKKLVR
ncbi:ROK family protein [Metabacillus sp. RGM 3146]|uniref:ROK family protein n=1 Tax=Metabacillus sp. RGM 3146 TaxID=3401092 RepID=UPI003B9D6CCD